PVGIGGFAPHPARGPVTALRVLGRGFEIAMDPSRVQRFNPPGESIVGKDNLVLGLDEPTYQLIRPLTDYCGIGSHRVIDCALAAILWRHPLILNCSCSEEVIDLARTIHAHTNRKEFPFTLVNVVPTSDAQIEAL